MFIIECFNYFRKLWRHEECRKVEDLPDLIEALKGCLLREDLQVQKLALQTLTWLLNQSRLKKTNIEVLFSQ